MENLGLETQRRSALFGVGLDLEGHIQALPDQCDAAHAAQRQCLAVKGCE